MLSNTQLLASCRVKPLMFKPAMISDQLPQFASKTAVDELDNLASTVTSGAVARETFCSPISADAPMGLRSALTDADVTGAEILATSLLTCCGRKTNMRSMTISKPLRGSGAKFKSR